MISCRFSCAECGLTDVLVSVRARDEAINVVEWMEGTVIVAIVRRHRLLSPWCRAKEIKEIKIPLDRDDPDAWVGKQTDRIPPEGGPKKEE